MTTTSEASREEGGVYNVRTVLATSEASRKRRVLHDAGGMSRKYWQRFVTLLLTPTTAIFSCRCRFLVTNTARSSQMLDPYKSSLDVDAAAAEMDGMRVVDVERVVCEAARVAQHRLEGKGGKDEITMEDFTKARASAFPDV